MQILLTSYIDYKYMTGAYGLGGVQEVEGAAVDSSKIQK